MPDVELVLRGRNESQAAVNQAIGSVKQLQDAAAKPISVSIEPTVSKESEAQANAEFDAMVKKFLGNPIPLPVGIPANLTTQISAIEKALEGFRAKAQLGIVGPEDIAEVKRLESELNNLKGYAKAVGIDINTTNAKARLAELERELSNLQSQAKAGTLTIAGAERIQQVTGEVNNLKGALGGMKGEATQAGGVLESVFGSLSGKIAGALTVAGLTAFAGKALSTAVELGKLGESAIRSEKYFTAFSGSAKEASANLAAMQRATEGALTTQEAMRAGSKLLSMGLASNTSELEKVARMAVMLGGDTRSASEAIDEFSLLLANQSILRLDTFGISGAKVRARIEELQAATPGLSRETAFLNAVMEEGTAKMEQLAASGVGVGTSADRAETAVKELKTALGELVAKPYEVVVNVITKSVQTATAGINEISPDTDKRKAALQKRLEQDQKELADLIANNAPKSKVSFIEWDISKTEAQIAALDKQIAAIKQYGNLLPIVQKAQDDYAAATERVRQAQIDLAAIGPGEMRQLQQGTVDAAIAAQRLAKATLDAVTAASGYDNAKASILAVGTAFKTASDKAQALIDKVGQLDGSKATIEVDFIGPSPDELTLGVAKQYEKKYGVSEDLIGPTVLEANKAGAEVKAQVIKDAKDAAKQSAAAWQSAFEKTADKIRSELNKGMEFSIGLKDMRQGGGDIFAPGKNGPFENIYRLQAWLTDNSWGETAQKLGVSKEQAAKIVSDFQNGIFSPDVIKAIDTDKLAQQAQMTDLAAKTQEAFSKAIAKKAGVSTDVTDALLGLKTDAKGNSAIKTSATAAADSVANTLKETTNDNKFIAKLGESAEKTWGHWESSFVAAAEQSQALQDAIDAMVVASLGRHGVKTAASATGQY